VLVRSVRQNEGKKLVVVKLQNEGKRQKRLPKGRKERLLEKLPKRQKGGKQWQNARKEVAGKQSEHYHFMHSSVKKDVGVKRLIQRRNADGDTA